MIKKYYLYFLFLSIFSYNIFALDGYVKTSFSYADKEWDFLPSIPQSFDTSSNNALEVFLLRDKFGLLINSTEFELDVQRSSEPKNVNLTSTNNSIEIFYLIESDLAISLGLEHQEADTQYIECYEFTGLIIGSCDGYDLKITNSKPQFDPLGENILMIDGKTQTIKMSLTKAVLNILADEIKFTVSMTEHEFNWLTPLSEIKSGFLYNLQLGNGTLGSSIESTLSRLPQLDPWDSYVANFNIKKDFQMNKHSAIFYDAHFLYYSQDNYFSSSTSLPNNNFKIKLGMKYIYNDFELSLHGTIYKNNLLGFEQIVLNQRTEHYFNQNFGLIGIEIKYAF
jgi:hypothetical protein